MIYYISDTHFFHDNAIRLNNRPFKSVEEMNETMITNWNCKVDKDDTVYFLGDFAYKCNNPNEVRDLVSKLNGNIHFICGNHDKLLKDFKFRSFFKSIKQYDEIEDNGRRVILLHYPMEDWNGKYRGSYHLYGHVHNNKEAISGHIQNRFNVGVDVNNFTPVTLDELIAQQASYKLDF